MMAWRGSRTVAAERETERGIKWKCPHTLCYSKLSVGCKSELVSNSKIHLFEISALSPVAAARVPELTATYSSDE